MGTLEGRSVNEIDASADGAGQNKAAVYDGERVMRSLAALRPHPCRHGLSECTTKNKRPALRHVEARMQSGQCPEVGRIERNMPRPRIDGEHPGSFRNGDARARVASSNPRLAWFHDERIGRVGSILYNLCRLGQGLGENRRPMDQVKRAQGSQGPGETTIFRPNLLYIYVWFAR